MFQRKDILSGIYAKEMLINCSQTKNSIGIQYRIQYTVYLSSSALLTGKIHVPGLYAENHHNRSRIFRMNLSYMRNRWNTI